MFEMTPEAREHVQGLLQEALEDHPRIDAVPALGFRIVHDDREAVSDLGLVLDEPRESDEVVEHDGQPVIIVDVAVAELLSGLTLDLVEGREGAQLGLRERQEGTGTAPEPEEEEPGGAAGAAS